MEQISKEKELDLLWERIFNKWICKYLLREYSIDECIERMTVEWQEVWEDIMEINTDMNFDCLD